MMNKGHTPLTLQRGNSFDSIFRIETLNKESFKVNRKGFRFSKSEEEDTMY
jgi:hypothetical protein